MKLAIVYPDLRHKGGAESVAVWTAVGLARRGHDVRLLTAAAEPGLWPDFPELAGLLEEVDADTRGRRVRRHLRTGQRLGARLGGFPIVYAQNRYGLLWCLEAPGRLAWLLQEPSRRLHVRATDRFLVEALARDDVDPRHPALERVRAQLRSQKLHPRELLTMASRRRRDRSWASRPELAFVNSRFSADTAEAALGRRMEVLDLGVPVPAVPAAAGDGTAGPREGIAVVSSGNPRKNLYGVLAAARELEQRRALPGLRFHVWGVATDRPEIRRCMEEWRLSERVVLHGFLEDADAQERLARTRLALFLPLCEPFGLVAVEALLLGVPLLASNHGGPAEILGRCGGGRTVDPLLPAAAADAIEEMLGSETAERGWREKAAEAGRTAARIFSMDGYLERTEEHLATLA